MRYRFIVALTPLLLADSSVFAECAPKWFMALLREADYIATCQLVSNKGELGPKLVHIYRSRGTVVLNDFGPFDNFGTGEGQKVLLIGLSSPTRHLQTISYAIHNNTISVSLQSLQDKARDPQQAFQAVSLDCIFHEFKLKPR